MNARSLTVLGITLLALGVATGGLYFFTEGDDFVRIGLLVSIPGATALCVGAMRSQNALNDDQLAAAHAAGYTLALDHVARGLLDQPTAPTGGGHNDDGHDATVCTLYQLHPYNERAVG